MIELILMSTLNHSVYMLKDFYFKIGKGNVERHTCFLKFIVYTLYVNFLDIFQNFRIFNLILKNSGKTIASDYSN